MTTFAEQLAAANSAILSSNDALTELNNQTIVLEQARDAANVPVNTQISIAVAPNTDVYYLYSQNGIIDVSQSNGGIIFPSGTTSERPNQPHSGTVRFNTNSSSLEIYTSKWQDVGTGAAGGSGSGGGATGGVFYENSNTITESFTSTPGKNIYSAGTLTLSNPTVVVTIANGSIWTVV